MILLKKMKWGKGLIARLLLAPHHHEGTQACHDDYCYYTDAYVQHRVVGACRARLRGSADW
jgi:hypothetical protein